MYQKINTMFNERVKFILIFVLLSISFIIDLVISSGIWQGLIFLDNEVYGVIIGISTSISLLGTTMLSLVLSRSQASYLGIDTSEYITTRYSKYFSMKKVIKMQLGLIFLSVICWIFHLPNLLFSILYVSLFLIWILTEHVFKFSFNSSDIKTLIASEVTSILTKKTKSDSSEKKEMINRLEKYSSEIIFTQNINEITDISDFYCNLVKKIPSEKNDLNELITDSYIKFCIENLKSDDTIILTNQYKSLAKILTEYNEYSIKCKIYEEITLYFFSGLEKIDYSTFIIYYDNINLYEIYELLKSNTFYKKENSNLNYFQSHVYQYFYRDDFKKFNLYLITFFDKAEHEGFDFFDEENAVNLLCNMLSLGDYDNFEHYFLKQLLNPVDYNKCCPVHIINIRVIRYLIYLNGLDTSEEIDIKTAKKFFNEHVSEISTYLSNSIFDYTLLKRDVIKNFSTSSYKFVRDIHGLSGLMPDHDPNNLVWWLIGNSKNHSLKKQVLKKYYLKNKDINFDSSTSSLKKDFIFFNKLFSIEDNDPEASINELLEIKQNFITNNE